MWNIYLKTNNYIIIFINNVNKTLDINYLKSCVIHSKYEDRSTTDKLQTSNISQLILYTARTYFFRDCQRGLACKGDAVEFSVTDNFQSVDKPFYVLPKGNYFKMLANILISRVYDILKQ